MLLAEDRFMANKQHELVKCVCFVFYCAIVSEAASIGEFNGSIPVAALGSRIGRRVAPSALLNVAARPRDHGSVAEIERH